MSKRNTRILACHLSWNSCDLAVVSLELKVCGRQFLNRQVSLTLVSCKDEAQLLLTEGERKGLEVLWGEVLEGGEMKEKLIIKYMFYKSKLFL